MAKASVTPRVRDGKTTFLVRWRDEAGKQCKRSFARKTDANRFRTEVEHSLNTGTYVDQRAGQVSVKEYAETWRNAQPHRPNTARRVKSALTCHVYPAMGQRPMAAVRPSEVQAFVTGLSLKLAPASVRIICTTLTSVFKAARRDRLISYSPMDGVKKPAVHRAKVVPLTVEQVRALAGELPPRYRAMVDVGAQAGLRPGEVFGLQVQDVHFLRKLVGPLERQVQPDGGVGPLKNQSAYRTVPVGQRLIDTLAAHLAAYPAGPGEFIFRDEAGAPLDDHSFKYTWQRARQRAGLPGVGMHDLRHFYASLLIASGRSVKEVSERLGHSDAAMTLNVYSHLWPSDEDGTRRAVDEAFEDDDKREGMAG